MIFCITGWESSFLFHTNIHTIACHLPHRIVNKWWFSVASLLVLRHTQVLILFSSSHRTKQLTNVFAIATCSVTWLVLITSGFIFPKVICYDVHTMFIGNIVSILYCTWGNLDSVYREYFNNNSRWIHLSYLFLTVQSRSFAVWRETAARKCLFSLCALSCWELVGMIWLKIFLHNIHLCSINRNPGVAQGSTVILPSLLNSFISPYTSDYSCLFVHCFLLSCTHIICSVSYTLSIKAPD